MAKLMTFAWIENNKHLKKENFIVSIKITDSKTIVTISKKVNSIQ